MAVYECGCEERHLSLCFIAPLFGYHFVACGSQSILEILERILGFSAPHSGDFKPVKLTSCSTCLATLDSLLSEFLKTPTQVLRNFDLLSSKSEIISSPFLCYRKPFCTPSALNGSLDISTFPRIFGCI